MQGELFPVAPRATGKSHRSPVLVIEEAGNRVTLRIEGHPPRRFGPGLGRKPRAATAIAALLAASGCTWPEYTFEDGRGGAAGAEGSAGAAGYGGAR